MQPKQAIQIAIAAMQHEYQSLAVHANLCTKYGADYPAALAAVERRKELQAAIQVLRNGFQPALFK
jgi:DnaJ-domain-containing protein 1